MGASTSDILTALKNIVTALAQETQAYLNVKGTVSAANLSTPTVVKNTAGRLATISVISAGSAPGMAYDGASVSAQTKPLGVIPNTVGIFSVNLPTSFGILIVPGTGQVVTVGYS